MMKNREVQAKFRSEHKAICCLTGIAEDGITNLYEVEIFIDQVMYGRNGIYTKPPYSKFFEDKEQANRYAMSIIKKEKMVKC